MKDFGRHLLGQHYCILSLSESCHGVEKKQKYHFTQNYPPLACVVMKFNFFSGFLPYRCYIPNLITIAPLVLEKMLKAEAQRSPTHSKMSNNKAIRLLLKIRTPSTLI